MKALFAIYFLLVAGAWSCPPMIERNYTLQGPGGAYGYVRLCYHDRWGGSLFRQHVILVGGKSLNVTGRGLMVGAAGVFSVVGVASLGWRAFRRPQSVV